MLERIKAPFGDDDVAAQRILHAYVGAAFKELEERVAALTPVGLLEQLALANERVINEQAQRSFSMLTRVLGYGDLDETLAKRPEEFVRLNRAAISTRFLIEYVTTCPPSGSRPLSVATFDELLAIAGEILDVGGMSDTLLSQLAHPQIVIIPPRIFSSRKMRPATHTRASLMSRLRSRLPAATGFSKSWSGSLSRTPRLWRRT